MLFGLLTAFLLFCALATMTWPAALAQVPGTGGGPCLDGNSCFDSQQICDTTTNPPTCRIRHGSNCAREPTLCVTDASCTEDVCVCDTRSLDSGGCRPGGGNPMETTTVADDDGTTTESPVTAPDTTATDTTVTTTTSSEAPGVKGSSKKQLLLIFSVCLCTILLR